MKLSISVVTRNRANQLQQALESCLRCRLPEDTEFVVIDNASTDCTGQVVDRVLGRSGYALHYEKMQQNLGAGGGRNYGFSCCRGSYVYSLDDDAVIDWQQNPDFFMRALQLMDAHRDIAALTTQIYDTVWKANRVGITGQPVYEDLHPCLMLFGGSHFLRRESFSARPYFPNLYGYEELPPSLRAWDRGLLSLMVPSLRVIHQPAVNRWDFARQENHGLLINEIACAHAIKRMMYPALWQPMLRLGYLQRCRQHLKQVPDGRARADRAVQQILREYPIRDKISGATVYRLFRMFGSRVF